MRTRSPVTAHVLDSSIGKPAQDVRLNIERLVEGKWVALNQSFTNEDGRCPELLSLDYDFQVGIYKVVFGTGKYYQGQGKSCFYPDVEISFEITNTEEHYHIPLLLSPYSYTTYRGN
ncbi:hydroxyisourate hydrolase [Basidiobolus meristosporus CBS 931.73]|uniref:5-hydroxyisourate hydrolase n=1 Tax=Basidiobolus meristosporus CBS 931.73 TaxID=1314790 RepID=A0A1Y1XSK5_9FUNG|nr:hydroxyisourate hydrolase [Basidiobolus meristosporus CBS 931.73]|eukprot:ORX88718.1 hydroxyisourate hydrolase [Basidiobolus meristosporus CBS 931.73]